MIGFYRKKPIIGNLEAYWLSPVNITDHYVVKIQGKLHVPDRLRRKRGKFLVLNSNKNTSFSLCRRG